MIPTIETISVVCLTEDQEDGDLILDLMVDGINKVSLVIGLFFHIYFTINKITANELMYKCVLLLFMLISKVNEDFIRERS